MAKSREEREAERAEARRIERETAIWEAARRGSKIARKMVVIKGGKK